MAAPASGLVAPDDPVNRVRFGRPVIQQGLCHCEHETLQWFRRVPTTAQGATELLPNRQNPEVERVPINVRSVKYSFQPVVSVSHMRKSCLRLSVASQSQWGSSDMRRASFTYADNCRRVVSAASQLSLRCAISARYWRAHFCNSPIAASTWPFVSIGRVSAIARRSNSDQENALLSARYCCGDFWRRQFFAGMVRLRVGNVHFGPVSVRGAAGPLHFS